MWRRPKAIARGDPAHDAVVAAIAARGHLLPAGSVIWAQDETHLHLLPTLRASWTLRGRRPHVLTPGRNRQITGLGALEVTTGRWAYRLGKRSAADFVALLEQVVATFPTAPAILVICDNDSIHHAPWYGGSWPPPGPARVVRSALQPARQPGRTHLGRVEGVCGQHRGELAGATTAGARVLPRPVARPAPGHRRALDQPRGSPLITRRTSGKALTEFFVSSARVRNLVVRASRTCPSQPSPLALRKPFPR